MKNKLETNKHYKLEVNLFGRVEKYTGKILKVDGKEIRFETEDDNQCRALTIHDKDIIYSKEINEPKKVKKVHRISNKRKYTNLKPVETPDF